jgi:hypothetical protein
MTSDVPLIGADGYNHVHAHVRLRGGMFGALAVLVLGKLHLPFGPFLDVGDDPHDQECTPTVAVGRAEVR